jgi:hypothetical protein
MSEELQTVFQAVIRFVIYFKSRTQGALYYCESRWLSRVKVLHRVFELKEEVTIFLSDGKISDDANLCKGKGKGPCA